jgi:hypothetical protein
LHKGWGCPFVLQYKFYEQDSETIDVLGEFAEHLDRQKRNLRTVFSGCSFLCPVLGLPLDNQPHKKGTFEHKERPQSS